MIPPSERHHRATRKPQSSLSGRLAGTDWLWESDGPNGASGPFQRGFDRTSERSRQGSPLERPQIDRRGQSATPRCCAKPVLGTQGATCRRASRSQRSPHLALDSGLPPQHTSGPDEAHWWPSASSTDSRLRIDLATRHQCRIDRKREQTDFRPPADCEPGSSGRRRAATARARHAELWARHCNSGAWSSDPRTLPRCAASSARPSTGG